MALVLGVIVAGVMVILVDSAILKLETSGVSVEVIAAGLSVSAVKCFYDT